MNVTSKGKRITWVDAGKCIGILMVMLGHNWLHPKYCFYFYAFHMPLFFVLSGYTFSSRQSFGGFLLKKAKVLLIPYMTFALMCSLFYIFLNFLHTGHFHIEGMAAKYLFRGTETFLWFLPTLFLSNILVYCLDKFQLFKTSLRILCMTILLFLCGFICSNLYEIDYNSLGVIRLIPLATAFVVIGLVYRRYIEGYQIENNWIFITLVFVASIGLATLNYMRHNFTTMFDTGNYLIFINTAILATYGLILILKKFTFPRRILYIGESSILFYGIHRLVIEVCFIVYGQMGLEYDKVSIQSVLMAIFNVMATCVVIYPISKLIDRKCPWIIGKF